MEHEEDTHLKKLKRKKMARVMERKKISCRNDYKYYAPKQKIAAAVNSTMEDRINKKQQQQQQSSRYDINNNNVPSDRAWF
jgi:hypothetical protein